MFGRIVNRVRDMFAPRSVVVKNPRVISADEHRIDPALVSAEARATCEALKRRGFQAYIVGGAVRDLMLGVTPKDFDVATDATPEQVKRCQRRAVIIGRRFKLDDAAHTDVRTVPQSLCEGQHSVSAFSPVVVFHFSAVHRPYTATGFYVIGRVYHSVVQRYEDRGWLEHRTWLQKVAQ